MYYRRKILLALIQTFDNSISEIDLQLLLFLYCNGNEKPAYEFVPGKSGCFSFQAYQDLSTMKKYMQVEVNNNIWRVTDREIYLDSLNLPDKTRLLELHNRFELFNTKRLIQYLYELNPYYLINYENDSNYLNAEQHKKIMRLKPASDKNVLFTIGYEGKTVEGYVNQLIRNDIKVLCDVRKSSLSMKYGFSRSQLKNIVEYVGIKYLHFPELGIDAVKRQNLISHEEYAKLFDDYEYNTLPNRTKEIENVIKVLYDFKRIALTCFESDYRNCHRGRLAKVISNKIGDKFELRHI